MDAKDHRIETALGAHTNDGSTKYAPCATALQTNGNKPYHDVASNSLVKVDVPTARPCAIIGPDRVVPPQSSSDLYQKKVSAEPWPYPDTLYQPPPEYPHKAADYPPPRNISPRQTFQENMQRIMVPPTYVSMKNSEERNLKNLKLMPPEAKYCDVPYTISPLNIEPKIAKSSEGLVPNNSPAYSQPVPPPGWSPSSVNVRPLRPYGAPDLYQYSEFPNYPGPRPISMIRPHRNVHEDVPQAYQDRFYPEANVRFKPYPSPKERPHQHLQARYDYIANYPNAFHLQNPYQHHKYDLQKSIPPQPCPVYPPMSLKYLDRKMPPPNIERYQRSPSQVNFSPPYCNQNIPPSYGTVPGNCIPNRPYPYSPDPSTKSMMQNRLYFDNNTARKYYPGSENIYINDPSRPQTIKNDMLYQPYPQMQPLPPHLMYRKESTMKGFDHAAHFRNFEYPTNLNHLSRLPLQFSPQTISISPDSNISNDTTQALNAQEDCGYVSQSSTASVKSIESSSNRTYSDLYRRHDARFEATAQFNNSVQRKGTSSSSKDNKKDINVRQFLQMWNEGDDEGNENNKDSSIQKDSSNNVSLNESGNSQGQLYVLGLVNVPSEELSKYEHIQKISKLPENIKGYNSIEILNQYEKLVESPGINHFHLTTKSSSNSKQKDLHSARSNVARQGIEVLPRPISPLDVEAKISQSVIHKEVGCNFEIRPCSPQMLNVELATPVHNVLGERFIEKVVNPIVTKSPMIHRIDDINICSPKNSPKSSSCKMVHNQYPSPNTGDSLKTNYCLQDLESNSGVGLASLPRLDNDIELNFPEINQQFINANKIEPVKNSSLRDLPILDTDNVSNAHTNGNKMHNKPFTPEHINSGSESDKEFSKLSKYRKHKRSNSITIERDVKTNNSPPVHRTDSVIIKNPENAKSQEDHLNTHLTAIKSSTGDAINNLNELVESDRLLNYVNQDLTSDIADTAIDFSLNKHAGQRKFNNYGILNDSIQNNKDLNKFVVTGNDEVKDCRINSLSNSKQNSTSNEFSVLHPKSSQINNLFSSNTEIVSNNNTISHNDFTNKEINSSMLNNKVSFHSFNEENIVHGTVITNLKPKDMTSKPSVSEYSYEDSQQKNSPTSAHYSETPVNYEKPSNHSIISKNSPLSRDILSEVIDDCLTPDKTVLDNSLETELPLVNIISQNNSLTQNDENQAKYERSSDHNITLNIPLDNSDTSEFSDCLVDDSKDLLTDLSTNNTVDDVSGSTSIKHTDVDSNFCLIKKEINTEEYSSFNEDRTIIPNEAHQTSDLTDDTEDEKCCDDIKPEECVSEKIIKVTKEPESNQAWKSDLTVVKDLPEKYNDKNENSDVLKCEFDLECIRKPENESYISSDLVNISVTDNKSDNLGNDSDKNCNKTCESMELTPKTSLNYTNMVCTMDISDKNGSSIELNAENIVTEIEKGLLVTPTKAETDTDSSEETKEYKTITQESESADDVKADITAINLEKDTATEGSETLVYQEPISQQINISTISENHESAEKNVIDTTNNTEKNFGSELVKDRTYEESTTENERIVMIMENNETINNTAIEPENHYESEIPKDLTYEEPILVNEYVPMTLQNNSDIINTKNIAIDISFEENKAQPELFSHPRTMMSDKYIADSHGVKHTIFLRKELFSSRFQNLLLHNDGYCTPVQCRVGVEVNNRNEIADKITFDQNSEDVLNNCTKSQNINEHHNDLVIENMTNMVVTKDLSNEISDSDNMKETVIKSFEKEEKIDLKTFVMENNSTESKLIAEEMNEGKPTMKNNTQNNDVIENHFPSEKACRKQFSSRRNRTLKRSLSESAATEYTSASGSVRENYENNFRVGKRPKVNGSEILVNSHVISENLTSFIQTHRRNSISTIYNEENLFCIVFDNDCVITEENEDCQKICYTEIPDECLSTLCTESEDVNSVAPDDVTCEDAEGSEYDNEFILQNTEDRTIEETWVEDVACMETVYSDDIAEDVIISAPLSPVSAELSEDETEETTYTYNNVNENEHTNKVKHIYGNQLCDDDAQLVEKLYRTPQMDVNKTLIYRESRLSDDYNRCYDRESLEKVLSDFMIDETHALDMDNTEPSFQYTSNVTGEENILSSLAGDDTENEKEEYLKVNLPEEELKKETYSMDVPKAIETKFSRQEETEMYDDCHVNYYDNSISNMKDEDKVHYTISSSPEVSSTTSEEKGSAILLKIRSYKGTKISEINEMGASLNQTHSQRYDNSNYNFCTSRPLLTKAAQKYIPPLKETIRDLKVKLHLPKQSLYKLQQLKKSKEEPKINTNRTKNYIKNLPQEYTKKPKPKFEDVLKSIDEIQFKMHKEKYKKPKQSIPKVIIKKNENGAHYASTQSKEKYNPDLTGRKWQPWVFIEKSKFIDKMALKHKFKAIYSHRKKTYVLAESFKKYKSITNSKFVISPPKSSDNLSTGKLKYTFKLTH